MQPLPTVSSRTEQVYQQVRDRICDCTLEPGMHLRQEELAAKLNVSRQPVQQAMLLLKHDGLVVERGGRSLYVAPFDPDAIQHRYQIRLVLDQLAARLIAEQAAASPEFAERLRREGEVILVEGERALENGSAPDAVGQDVRFHTFLYQMSGNPVITPTADPHWNFLKRVMVAVLLHAERGKLVWRQHRDILETLAEGNPEEGQQLVADHVRGAQEALMAALSSGEQGTPKLGRWAETGSD